MQLNKSLPHIKILATGGTIAGSAAQAGQLTGYTAGALGIESLISAVPELESAAQVSGEQIANIDSCNITSGLWFKLAQRCNELMADDDVDGIVITHGTDTLEETAYFLNLTVKGSKPVVLTGAMRPATAISADGPLDLLNAVKTAACREACGKGVLVVMNDIIMAARYATKTSAFKVEAFQAVPYGQLGTIAGGRVYFEAAISKCHTVKSVFAGKNYTSLPRTDIIYTHCDDDGVLIEAAVNAGAQGIIYAGSGMGSIHCGAEAALLKAVQRGAAVVRSTRVSEGRVLAANPKWDEAGFISGGNLNPQKARILLQLALTCTHDTRKIQEFFDKY